MMYCSTLLLGLLAGPALAAFTFNSTVTQGFAFDGRIPTNGISPACSTAYSASINCDASLLQLTDPEAGPNLHTKSGLEKVCTTDCLDALNDWNKKMHQSCTVQDKVFADQENLSYLSFVLNEEVYVIQENIYWPFCFKDSATGTFCLAAESLPEWPPISGQTDEAATSAFCKSDCRMQESLLMNRYYNDYDLMDAEVECKELNFSRLPMNLNMNEAFGYVSTSQEGVVGSNTGGKLIGGKSSWEAILKGSVGAGSSSSGAGSATAAGGQKGAASRVRVSGVFLVVAVGFAVM